MLLEKVTPPTTEEMARASGLGKKAVRDWEQYCRGCRRRFGIIRDIIQRRFGPDLKGRSFLDWGSAAGGVAILVHEELPVEMHAADVDAHSLAWLRKTNPEIQCSHLTPGKVLPFPDNAFDCIYGISVLTHIPPELQEFYLGELRRVSKPGALVILTVKGYAACAHIRKKPKRDRELHVESRAVLKEKGIIYHSYPENILGSMDFTEEGDYGITYHSREYVEEVFGRYFTVDGFQEGIMGRQDVVTLTPRKDKA